MIQIRILTIYNYYLNYDIIYCWADNMNKEPDYWVVFNKLKNFTDKHIK